MKDVFLRKALTSLALLACIALLACCAHDKTHRIGISQCSTDDWRSKMNEEILREAMFHDNVEVEIRSADDSSEKQIRDLEYFQREGFDIIVVAPNEADALTPKIKEIYESGLPVIVFDRAIHGDYYTAFQGADNAAIGKMASKMAASYFATPNVIEIKGLKGSTPAEDRCKGFHVGADSLGVRIVGEAYGNWNYEDARTATAALLKEHPEANVIYCHNDRMALGASEVAKEAGRDDIRIIGVDAAPSIGIKAVDEGRIDATFLYPTDGDQLIKTSLAILEGKPYEKRLILPSPAPVDPSNAQILLLQDKALREETGKIRLLQEKMDVFSEKYSMQSHALYATIIIIVLCAVLIFLLLRSYWNNKRHRQQIESTNKELARQRDELDALYSQLQEATGSKLTFFTNVSHDLRTPLTLIADPVNRLAEADNLTPQQHTLMQLASKNVMRLQRLINQILDIRKYDNGQLKLHLTNLNLTEALAEWVAPFAEIAAKRHIRFCSEIPADTEIVTAIDVEKTERILFNLLSNAFKFTPENGTIKVSLQKEREEAVIKIEDTGIGIPPEEINQIFDRFFKTDRINPNGSGIGLALSKVFIDMHGGSISVQSNEKRGSIFTVKFPIRLVQDEAAEIPAPQMSNLAEIGEVEEAEENPEISEDTPTVLIIDDNRDICILLKSILSEKYTVITAHSGAQGIKLATKYIPDLVICDVMMPGMDGYQVCRELKKESMTSHIPVLMLTACSRDEQRTEGYECGADAFMSKPFASDMMLARCKSLLENRRLIYQRGGAPEPKREEVPAKGGATAISPPGTDEFVERFVTLVQEQISNPDLTVEVLADQLGLSRVQMYRKIKALTNYSASEMIRNIRLKRATVMLKTTGASVSEVAYAVGFSSPSYFSRCYKEFFDESPGETHNRIYKGKTQS